MLHEFPSASWVQALEAVLNNDERYTHVARNWEGDIAFVVAPAGGVEGSERAVIYLDLWHGKCRRSVFAPSGELSETPTFTLTASRADFVRVLSGELDPMQALLTRKIQVRGDFAYFLKNVPVVLDFVRCCRKVEIRRPVAG